MIRARVLAGLGLAALGACTVGPDFRRPAVATPAAYTETATPGAGADVARWWTQFHDPVLQRLIERALAGNLNLQQAASRVREARFEAKIAAAAEWPTLNAAGDAVNFRSNRPSEPAGASQGGAATASGAFALPNQLNLYSVGFDATWEVDLFGGVRRQIEEARDNREAAEWAGHDAEVTLTAEVASDYFGLRETQARIAIGEAELARQQEIGALVGARRQSGFVTNLDVNQQTGQTATAAAQLRELEGEARAQIHAIEILLGEPPETLEPDLAGQGTLTPAPPPLPVGLPSELLQRRPDIREAERKLAAATAEIGVQTANLYPKLDLIPLASFTGMNLPGLFSAQNLGAAELSTLTQPVFNAGRTRAAIGEAREKAEEAALAYRGTVLGAFRDVEDALARLRAEEARRAQLTQAVAADANSLAIAQDQYRVGLVTYLNVYAAENALLNARDQFVQSDAQSTQDLVSLYKALGGGWGA